MRNAVQNALWYMEKKSEQNTPAALDACTDDLPTTKRIVPGYYDLMFEWLKKRVSVR